MPLTEEPRLVQPTTEVRESWLAGEQADRELDGGSTDLLEHARRDFASFVPSRQGVQVIWGVPTSVLWYVAGPHYLGELVIRHRLTPALVASGGNLGYSVSVLWRRQGHGTRMLAAGLLECHRLGLTDVLLTCEADNEGRGGSSSPTAAFPTESPAASCVPDRPERLRAEHVFVTFAILSGGAGTQGRTGSIRQEGNALQVRLFSGRDPVTGRDKYLTATIHGTDICRWAALEKSENSVEQALLKHAMSIKKWVKANSQHGYVQASLIATPGKLTVFWHGAVPDEMSRFARSLGDPGSIVFVQVPYSIDQLHSESRRISRLPGVVSAGPTNDCRGLKVRVDTTQVAMSEVNIASDMPVTLEAITGSAVPLTRDADAGRADRCLPARRVQEPGHVAGEPA